MAVPPSTAEVKGLPPDPLSSEKLNVHALSALELAATNLFIQTAAVDYSQLSKSSSPVSGSLTLVKNLQQQDALAPNPLPYKQLEKSSSEKASDLGQSSKLSSPTAVVHPPTTGTPATGIHCPSYSDANQHPAMVPSFAEVTGNGYHKNKSGPSLNIFGEPPPLPGANIINNEGVDILVFEDEATNLLAAPYKWALVGKFSHNLPNTQSVGKFFTNLKLCGEFELQWLSHRQILIVLSEEVDHALIWSRGFWFIDGCSMRTLKWTPTFNAKIESPFAPVWVSLPGLPVHLFDKRALYLLASQLGRPVMVDTPTAARKRATRARICVEINLLSPLKHVIPLCINGCIIEQHVIFEDVPSYCVHCSHIGHDADKCFVKFEELKSAYVESQGKKLKKIKIKGKNKMESAVLINHHGSDAEVNGPELKEGEVVTVKNSKLDNVGLVDHDKVLGLLDYGKGACGVNDIGGMNMHVNANDASLGDVEQSTSVGVYIRGLEELVSEPSFGENSTVAGVLHGNGHVTIKEDMASLHDQSCSVDVATLSSDFSAVVDDDVSRTPTADLKIFSHSKGPLSDGPGSLFPMQPIAQNGHPDVFDVSELHDNNQLTVYVPVTTPLATIPPHTPNNKYSVEESDDESYMSYEFDDEMITEALLNKCLTPDGRKSASKDNFFDGDDGRASRSKTRLS